MPYITQEKRKNIHKRREDEGNLIFPDKITNAGEFNFAVSKMIQIYMENKEESYQSYNDVLGALEGIKLELYRRHTSNYENLKIEENGDL